MSDGTPQETAAAPRVLTRRFRARQPKVERRDFRVPPRPYRKIVSELESLSGALATRLSSAFSDALQRRVSVAPLPVRFPSFAVLRGELDDRSWAQPISTRKGGRGLIVLDARMQQGLLDLLLGAEPAGDLAEGGGPTEDAAPEDGGEHPKHRFGFLSRAVMRPTVAVGLREVNQQFGLGRDAAYAIDDSAAKLGLGGYLPDGEACVTLDFAVDGAGIAGTMSVLLPLRPLQSLVRRDRGPAVRPRDPRARAALESLVKGLDMPLSVRVGRADIEVEEYLRLSVGDVLVLDQGISRPLEVAVGGLTLFTGRPGRSGGRLAVRIVGDSE